LKRSVLNIFIFVTPLKWAKRHKVQSKIHKKMAAMQNRKAENGIKH
tara:strand:- start:272 stop:409 length:138 start_codon:yes stop_codon:yes gene_type:complete